MTVSAVGSHDNSKFNTIVKSTAVGMAGGYALKYLYPVQKQEDNISRRSMLNYCRKVTNRAKADDFRGNGITFVFIHYGKSVLPDFRMAHSIDKIEL